MREKELYLAARLLYEILGKYLSPGVKELISVWVHEHRGILLELYFRLPINLDATAFKYQQSAFEFAIS